MLARLVPGSVRARLLLLLALAAVPLIILVGAVAWQEYRSAVNEPLQAAVLARETAVARHEAAIEGVAQLMTAASQTVAARASASVEVCDEYLRDVLALSSERYANIAVVDASGMLRCSALAPPPGTVLSLADEDWFQQVKRTGQFSIGASGQGRVVKIERIPVGYPILLQGRFAGAVAASIRMDWLTVQSLPRGPIEGLVLWLIGKDGGLHPAGMTPSDALPPPETLRGLIGTEEASVQLRARDGSSYAYASQRMSDGLRLLVGVPAGEAIEQAQTILVWRAAELTMLLLAGMAAVWIGVSVAVALPIKRLTGAVRHWRAGGTFESDGRAGMPSEVAELSLAFTQATRALAGREEDLRRATAEQELLMQEIHHRVKNNLQIIASLLNLQASRIRLPEAQAEFQSARDRVRALATLHRHLYVQGELHTINMRSFLIELCAQLFQAMGETEGERIHLAIAAPELQMSSDQAVPFALIVTEAVSNAIKYAFPGGRHGHIAVRLTTTAGGAHLVIEDDGVGIPPGPAVTETGTRDGLGIQLIRGFSRQLGATLLVEERPGGRPGTRYTLDTPLRGSGTAAEQADRTLQASAPQQARQPDAGATARATGAAQVG